jgi:hypothetical protein
VSHQIHEALLDLVFRLLRIRELIRTRFPLVLRNVIVDFPAGTLQTASHGNHHFLRRHTNPIVSLSEDLLQSHVEVLDLLSSWTAVAE